MITAAFPTTATLIGRQKTGTDPVYGNDVFTPVSSPVRGIFNPGNSVEQLQGQDVVTTQPSFYLLDQVTVTAIDAIDVNGLRYEADGAPSYWTHPMTGATFPTEVRLKRVTG